MEENKLTKKIVRQASKALKKKRGEEIMDKLTEDDSETYTFVGGTGSSWTTSSSWNGTTLTMSGINMAVNTIWTTVS